MRRILCTLLLLCLILIFLGCGKAPQPAGAVAPTTAPVTSIATEPTAESTTVPTAMPTTVPPINYPVEIGFNSYPMLEAERVSPTTPHIAVIWSEEAFAELCSQMIQEDPAQDRVDAINELVQKYDREYFASAALILMSSANLDIYMETVDLLDEKTVRIVTGYPTYTTDGSSWDDNLTSRTYQRLLIELDRKLPKDAEMFWIQKKETFNKIASAQYCDETYPDGLGSYSVRYEGKCITAPLPPEAIPHLLSIGVPQTPSELPEALKYTGTPLSFQATCLLIESQDPIPHRNAQIIRSNAQLQASIDEIIAQKPDDAQRNQSLVTVPDRYDQAYFDTGCLILLQEKLWRQSDTVEVEKLDLLDDGTVRLQMHSTVSAAREERDFMLTDQCAYYLIEIDRVLPENTEIAYVDRHEYFLEYGDDFPYLTKPTTSAIYLYSETFIEKRFKP